MHTGVSAKKLQVTIEVIEKKLLKSVQVFFG